MSKREESVLLNMAVIVRKGKNQVLPRKNQVCITRAYLCIWMYTSVYLCIWTYTSVYLCIWMYTSVYLCIRMYTSMYLFILTYTSVSCLQHSVTHETSDLLVCVCSILLVLGVIGLLCPFILTVIGRVLLKS